jgi:hypothetical protein
MIGRTLSHFRLRFLRGGHAVAATYRTTLYLLAVRGATLVMFLILSSQAVGAGSAQVRIDPGPTDGAVLELKQNELSEQSVARGAGSRWSSAGRGRVGGGAVNQCMEGC